MNKKHDDGIYWTKKSYRSLVRNIERHLNNETHTEVKQIYKELLDEFHESKREFEKKNGPLKE